jgi:hypothetical protein
MKMSQSSEVEEMNQNPANLANLAEKNKEAGQGFENHIKGQCTHTAGFIDSSHNHGGHYSDTCATCLLVIDLKDAFEAGLAEAESKVTAMAREIVEQLHKIQDAPILFASPGVHCDTSLECAISELEEYLKEKGCFGV